MRKSVLVLLVVVATLTLSATPVRAAGCPCPQCIIFDPICAYDYKLGRRGFSSGCHMLCYNRCYGTNYMRQSKGSLCV